MITDKFLGADEVAARIADSATLAITDQRDRTANITATDVLASNGVIHVIDKVILPPQ